MNVTNFNEMKSTASAVITIFSFNQPEGINIYQIKEEIASPLKVIPPDDFFWHKSIFKRNDGVLIFPFLDSDVAYLFENISDFEKCYHHDKIEQERIELVLFPATAIKPSYYYFDILFPPDVDFNKLNSTKISGWDIDDYELFQLEYGLIYKFNRRMAHWFFDMNNFQVYHETMLELRTCDSDNGRNV